MQMLAALESMGLRCPVGQDFARGFKGLGFRGSSPQNPEPPQIFPRTKPSLRVLHRAHSA